MTGEVGAEGKRHSVQRHHCTVSAGQPDIGREAGALPSTLPLCLLHRGMTACLCASTLSVVAASKGSVWLGEQVGLAAISQTRSDARTVVVGSLDALSDTAYGATAVQETG